MLLLVQLVLLAAVFLLPAGDDWHIPHWLSTAAHVVWFAGAAALIVGLVNLGKSLTPLPTPAPHGELRTGGMFRYVRHPIYSGVMALAVGSAIPSGNFVVALAAAALIGWLMVKARWEERRLRERYPGYADYAGRTPRFIPFWPR